MVKNSISICHLRQVLTSLTLLLVSFSYSQNGIPTIKIDIDKKTINPSVLPFDTPIDLQIMSSTYELESGLNGYTIRKKKGKKYLDKSNKKISNKYIELRDKLAKNPGDATIKKEFDKEQKNYAIESAFNTKVTKVKKGEYKALIPFVKPNESYELMFKKKISEKELNLFVEICRLKSNGSNDASLKKFYDKNILGLETLENTPYQQFYFHREDNKNPEKVSIGFIETNWTVFKSPAGTFPLIMAKFNAVTGNQVTYGTGIPIQDIRRVGALVRDYKLNIEIHSKLLKLTGDLEVAQLVSGLRAFGKTPVVTDLNDFKTIKRNLDENWKIINQIDKQLTELIAIEPNLAVVKTFHDNSFLPIREALKKNRELFSALYKDFKTLLQKDFSFAVLISAESMSADIKTTNGQIIVPDFGLINMLAFKNDGTTRYIPRPYVGINFHFGGGIDRKKRIRNIPTKSRDRFWLRSSISLGVTIGKIDEGGFSDFYNGFSPSLGYNYRIDDQIRIGTGLLLLREKDNNPFVDKNNIEPAIYANLTFDFGLFETLGKAASKLIGI